MAQETLSLLYSHETIHERVAVLADRISSDYPEGGLVMVGVLKGAFMFLADLARAMRVGTIFRPRPGRMNLVDGTGIREAITRIFGKDIGTAPRQTFTT